MLENHNHDMFFVKKDNFKQDISLSPIWRNIFFNEKRGNNYVAFRKKNSIICEFNYLKKDLVLELSIVVYKLRKFRTSLNLFCELLFNKYTEINKITVYLLSPERLGVILMSLCGFKKEVKVKNLYRINEKKCDYIIFSKFR